MVWGRAWARPGAPCYGGEGPHSQMGRKKFRVWGYGVMGVEYGGMGCEISFYYTSRKAG
jgi:hypothetical protein